MAWRTRLATRFSDGIALTIPLRSSTSNKASDSVMGSCRASSRMDRTPARTNNSAYALPAGWSDFRRS